MADGSNTSLGLWPFQTTVARGIWRELVLNNAKSTLLTAPTGSGKTTVAAFLTQQLNQRLGWNVLFLAPKREIVHQTAARMLRSGIRCGTIMAGEVLSPDRPVQIASNASYLRWRGRKVANAAPSLIIVDEAHGALSRTMVKLLDDYAGRGSKLLGMTATPVRSDGQGLGRLFDTMVCAPGVHDLTVAGFLVPMDYYVGIVPDTRGIRITAGDYSQDELAAVMNREALVGDVADNYARLAKGRPALLFASGVQHSLHLRDRLRGAGFHVEHIDGETPSSERDAIHNKLAHGELDIVTNANVYIEGTDLPCVSCIIDAQPTKSLGRYLQKAGRGLRIQPGKSECVYLDHAGNVYEHGRVELPRTWKLTQGRELGDQLKRETAQRRAEEHACSHCGALFAGHTCPKCGATRERPAKLHDTVDANLEKLGSAKQHPAATEAEKQAWYQQALGQTRAWHKKDGMAAYAFNAKFGSMPPRRWQALPALQPSDGVRSYLKSRLIRQAKSVSAWRISA